MDEGADVAMNGAAVLRAGGLLPPLGSAGEPVAAMTFVHPAAAGRTLVRLASIAIEKGVETELGLAGFRPVRTEGGAVVVARGQARALGFPAWALVHDPANARYALDVMKGFNVAKKLARTKPGHARDAVARLAEGLGRDAPHFLPSFWEEAGRMFITSGALAQATQSFERARAAEREHGLPVDPVARDLSFVAFALAGAVSAKTLSAYPAQERQLSGAAEAHRRFLALCIARTRGGLVPWASFPKDLASSAKAAGVLPDDALFEFLRATIDSSGLNKAEVPFWSAVADTVARLDAPAKLAMRFPRGGETAWLRLLERWGAIEAVVRGEVPAAAWVSKLLRWGDHLAEALVALIERLLPRLVTEGVTVQLAGGGHRWRALDAIETLLAGGVSVDAPEPTPWRRFDLASWARQPTRRDPVHVATHPKLGGMLNVSVADVAATPEFQRAARGMVGLATVREFLVQRQIRRVAAGSVVDAELAMKALPALATPGVLAEFPAAAAALASADAGHALRVQLRGGLAEELVWPALDAAQRDVGPTPELVVMTPYAAATDGRRVIVVGPDRRLLEHDLRLPPRATLRFLRFADGQLLVGYTEPANWAAIRCYWSGNPGAVHELTGNIHAIPSSHPCTPMSGGGVIADGGRRLRAGDTDLAPRGEVYHDAEGTWVQDASVVHAVDPETGRQLGVDHPAFLAPRPGSARAAAVYRPAATTGSPLGARDGQYGFARFAIAGDPSPSSATTRPGPCAGRASTRRRATTAIGTWQWRSTVAQCSPACR